MSKCAVKACERHAEWRPVLLVFTEGVQEALRMQLGMKICNGCKSTTRDALSVLVEHERERLEPMIENAGRKNPDWKNVGVQFIRHTSTEARAMNKAVLRQLVSK